MLSLLAAVAAAGGACGGEAALPVPPAGIVEQPADTAVFEGQPAFFRVVATSTAGMTYQWQRNGNPIQGAIDSHLQTPQTVPGDDGAVYSVTVTNGGRTPVDSRAARLTVYPPLDLRFKWVVAPYRLHYTLHSEILSSTAASYPGAGTGLVVGSQICGNSMCAWDYGVTPALAGMSISYLPGALQSLGPGWASGLPSDTVVSSLDIEEEQALFAVSLTQITQAGEFRPVTQGSVSPDQLQAVAASEGAQGRVITAVTFQGGLVSYVSYGWSRNAGTVYEAQVARATFDDVVAKATALASQGYIITASGAGHGGADGLLLVGTRPQGSSAPRSITALNDLGFAGPAVVAAFFDGATVSFSWIGEQ